MRLEAKKLLFDMQDAGRNVLSFIEGRTIDDYRGDLLLKSGVERQLEILGKALGQLNKLDPKISGQFPDRRRMIAFRNILVHGYADVDDEIVWAIATENIPDLLLAISGLIGD